MTQPIRDGLAPELKFTALDLTEAAVDGIFEGYASVFDTPDLARDVVVSGAFRESLKVRGAAGVRMLYQHDSNQPIGVWDRITEDHRGLKVRGRLTLEVERAREVLWLLRAGALDGLSIGFKAVRARRDAKSGLRRIEHIDLWEISVVTFPMQTSARISGVKASPFGGALPTHRQFERWLVRDAGLTRSQARALMRAGFDGLSTPRDAGADRTGEAQLADKIRQAAGLFKSAT